MERAQFSIDPVPPYSFELTAAYATYFRGQYGADSFQGGVFRRLLDLRGTLALATVYSLGTVDQPRLGVVLTAPRLGQEEVAEAQRQVAWLLGTEQDLTPFYRMALQDGALAPLARGFRGLHIPHTGSVYEALVLAILGQQISSHVARILRTLLIQTYGAQVQLEGVTYHAFPRPEALMEAGLDGLRAIKFSTRKAQYILDIATRVASGDLDLESLHSRPDDEVMRTLTSIRGVGPWTVQWLLIRALGRRDGFPHGDLALQRSLGMLVNGGTPLSAAQALEYSRRWSPYRSYVTTYIFAASRSGRWAELLSADLEKPTQNSGTP